MQTNEYLEKLKTKVLQMFLCEPSGHDVTHLERVCNIASSIQKIEGGNLLVISTAAYLHDIHRLKEKQTKVFCPPKESLPIIREMLTEVSFPTNLIDQVLHCVEFHEEYSFSESKITVTDLETLILQDADNLDAIGAIGIGRTFAFGSAHGLPMWLTEKPFDRDTFDESKPDPDTIHHFYSKLLKLKENMNTKTGKEMAQKRHEFMELFLDHFFKEWQGEY